MVGNFVVMDILRKWHKHPGANGIKLPVTRVVDLLMTYECNSACPYCFISRKCDGSAMSIATLERSIDWIADTAKDQVEIVFMGGEPTLEPDKIEYAVQYAEQVGASKDLHFHFTMTTNFLNLDESLAEMLARRKISYLMSVDGYGERHDRSRPAKDRRLGSPFSMLQKRIQMLKSYQPKLAARVTVTPATVNYLAHDMQKLFEMGFEHFIVSPATGIHWEDELLQMYGEELTRFALQRDYSNDDVPRPYISPVDDADKGYTQWGCGAGRGRVAISPEGLIHACARFTGMADVDPLPLGDIHQGILPDGNIIKFQDNSYRSRQKCLTCSIRETCLGGCPAVNWEETQSLVVASQNECRMLKVVAAVRKVVNQVNDNN